jgi:hypothetical protein
MWGTPGCMGTGVTAEIKMVIWLFVATILGLGVIGFATRYDHLLRVRGTERAAWAREPLHAAQATKTVEAPAPSSFDTTRFPPDESRPRPSPHGTGTGVSCGGLHVRP